jgi:AcrR family transcriptional regulator
MPTRLLALGGADWHQGRVPDRDARSRDPLDHLFRSTVPTSEASAPPKRAGGTRSRAGNAMARTRAGLLEGACRAVAARGTRRTTMNDIAGESGVAKATLYNHFRTKDDVWSALVEAEVRAVADECRDKGLVEALAHAAGRLSEHPAVRRVADTEPAALAGLLARRPLAAGWRAAEESVRARLAAEGLAGDELVLRWLVSHLAMPAPAPAIRAAAEALVHGLPADPVADRRVPA